MACDIDDAIAEDMATVFALAVRLHAHPDALDYGPDFEHIVAGWRSELLEPPQARPAANSEP